MKKTIMALFLGGLLAAGSSASAYSIGTTDVGGRDTFRAAGKVNSGEPSETLWVNTELGVEDIAYVVKYDMDDTHKWQQVYLDGVLATGIYAFYLGGTPDYFLIKTDSSRVNGASNDHYLFENADKPEWAVVNINEDLGIESATNIKAVSHVTEFDAPGDDAATVPEPGTMMLLGAGCLGLAIYGKRRKNA